MKKLLGRRRRRSAGWGRRPAHLRQGPRPVTVDAAVKRFRAGAAPSGPPTNGCGECSDDGWVTNTTEAPHAVAAAAARSATAARRPAPVASAATPATKKSIEDGVYVYDTKGFEQTNALGGARHDYPAESTITVQHGGCGWTTRWQPLQERWEQWQFLRCRRRRRDHHQPPEQCITSSSTGSSSRTSTARPDLR